MEAAGRGPRTGTPRWGYPSHRFRGGPLPLMKPRTATPFRSPRPAVMTDISFIYLNLGHFTKYLWQQIDAGEYENSVVGHATWPCRCMRCIVVWQNHHPKGPLCHLKWPCAAVNAISAWPLAVPEYATCPEKDRHLRISCSMSTICP